MQKADTLIRTKLHLPFTRPGLVSRPRLQERIKQGLCGPLTLITAPAGFGKTTLVSSCISNCGLPVAWLSLDTDDNQGERFLNYLLASLQAADHTIGSDAAALLAAARQAAPEAILTSLINDLETAGKALALVLDDYQFISSQAVHEAVAFLLEHCPRTFHLVIATRSDPPLPLTRLRARGQTVELRAADLSFTEAEAAQFLNDVMGLHLDARSVAALAERTEGWIAGLQMAALSMRDRKDVPGFIEGFSGTNRYILDYLLEEVLAGQPPEIQRFLLLTSILERLTAPLCDAITEIGEWRVESGNESLLSTLDSQPILEYLERANLFLVPLDDERIWYRYHHLFADLLRTRLQQTIKAEEVAALHLRAAQWFEQNGLPFEAIQHASLTSNNEWVERLIEQNYMAMLQRGDFSSLRFWTGKLSKELIYKRPFLCIHEALTRSWFGPLDEADELLAGADRHLRGGGQSPEIKSMLGYAAFVKSRVSALRGDIHQAIEHGITARENTPGSNPALLAGIGVMLGYGYFLDGDFTNAIQTLNETIQSGLTASAINSTVGAYCVLARLYAVQGQLHRSFDLYQEAGKIVHDVGGQHQGMASVVDVGIAEVLYEWNDLEAALAHMRQGLELIPLWSKADDIALAYTTLSRIQQAQGNTAAAVESIEQGSREIHSSAVFSEARDAVTTAEIKMQMAQGNSLAAGHWARSLEKRLRSGDPFRFEHELAQITLARVYISQTRLDEAIRLLTCLEEPAQSGGRAGRLIEILMLEALAMQKMGERTQALATLAKSLALAEAEGYLRIFLDEGQPMRMLLAQWLAHASAGTLRDYAARLLSQFEAEKHVVTAQEKATPAFDPSASSLRSLRSGQALVEPLSPRELEVLHLMALGKTNEAIARQLIVSTGTVKAHTASIYRKLDVANRTEAVARARQLSLLP